MFFGVSLWLMPKRKFFPSISSAESSLPFLGVFVGTASDSVDGYATDVVCVVVTGGWEEFYRAPFYGSLLPSKIRLTQKNGQKLLETVITVLFYSSLLAFGLYFLLKGELSGDYVERRGASAICARQRLYCRSRLFSCLRLCGVW